MKCQAVSHMLWVGKTVAAEPLVTTMAPPIGEAIRTTGYQNGMFTRE